jgi:hypothetical protein
VGEALYRFRMPIHPSSPSPPPHPFESGESAALYRRTPKRRRLPTGLPDPRASVLECGCGRSPPPLSNADRTLFPLTTSPHARKRRIRSAPSPHSKTSPTSHGATRSSRQRPGVRLWAKPSTDVECRADALHPHQLHTRSKAANPLRSIAALHNVAGIPRGLRQQRTEIRPTLQVFNQPISTSVPVFSHLHM